jgi:hypothetical protein
MTRKEHMVRFGLVWMFLFIFHESYGMWFIIFGEVVCLCHLPPSLCSWVPAHLHQDMWCPHFVCKSEKGLVHVGQEQRNRLRCIVTWPIEFKEERILLNVVSYTYVLFCFLLLDHRDKKLSTVWNLDFNLVHFSSLPPIGDVLETPQWSSRNCLTSPHCG